MNASNPRTVVGGIGVLVTSATLWLGGGFVGVLASVLLFSLWYLTPASYAATFGQVALVTVVLPAATTLTLVAGEIGTILVLLAPLVTVGDVRGRVVVGTVCFVVCTGGIWLLTLLSESLWVPTLVLVGGVTLALYVISRYETVVATEGGSDT